MSAVDVTKCWVDLFELSRFRGRRRRVFGPTVLLAARSSLPGAAFSADSAIAGPAAFVRFFASKYPGATIFWLLPEQVMPDLPAIGIVEAIDSIQIRDAAPVSGDVGYDTFVIAIDRPLSRMQ